MSSEKPPPASTPILYHTRSIQETTTALATDLEDGLTKVDAANRLQKYGKNELTGQGDVSAWKVFFAQLCNSMTIVLLLAFGASIGAKDYVEAIVVGFVIVTNTLIGFSQEYKAEKTMESLRQLTSPTALVVREGAQHHIPALEVVPGDVVQFKSGDVIPADLRLFEAFNLEIDEALLTGESVPVSKIIEPILNPEESVGDRVNLAYSSTIVSKGRGKGIVINTGMNSEMGKIAKALTETEKTGKTELQKRVDRLALYLLVLAVVLGLIVFTANGWVINTDIVLYAISVAISVIPEGLVAVMTITMSVSVREMAKHKAIVRKLTALEAIGAVSNICSDKTGTITQGRMVLTKVHLIGMGNYAVSGEGYNPTGDISPLSAANSLLKPGNVTPTPTKNTPLPKDNLPEPLLRLVRVASLCNQAVLRKGNRLPSTTVIDMQSSHSLSPVEKNSLTRPGHSTNSSSNIEADGGWKAFGDPTDNALQVFAHKLGMSKPALMSNFELICEFPFESAIKRASVVVREKQSGEVYVLSKGATEQVLSKCQYVDPTAVMKNMESFAASGLRVLAIADRKIERQITNEEILKWTREDADKEMTLLGIVGIYDPPRPQSKGAIETCAQAGISVHMLTGDHPRTAAAIALSVGLISRSEAKATVVTNAPAPSGHGLELFRSITMAEDEQATPNIVMTAPAFDALSDAEIDKLSHLPKVIARCTPHTKTRMVAALHRRNRVVAMTGDGVNDAPSLKAADVGIAMGLAGSDVAKQASDIVLTNDNFATISKAVFEGRRIFDNIQKFILHLLSTNIAEVILLVLGLAFKDPTGTSVFPMSPVQILWLNMATSSPPAMGLGFEKAANHLQHVPPRPKNKGMFGRELTADMFFFGTLMGILSLANWVIVIFGFGDGRLGNAESHGLCNKAPYDLIQPGGPCELVYTGRAVTFLTLIFMILLHAINCRHARNFGFKGLQKNKLLMWSIIIGAAVSIPVIYIPGTEEVFKHKPIGWIEWALVLGANIIFMGLSMAYKLLKRTFMKPLVRDLDEDEEEEENEYEYIDEDAEYATHGIRKVVE